MNPVRIGIPPAPTHASPAQVIAQGMNTAILKHGERLLAVGQVLTHLTRMREGTLAPGQLSGLVVRAEVVREIGAGEPALLDEPGQRIFPVGARQFLCRELSRKEIAELGDNLRQQGVEGFVLSGEQKSQKPRLPEPQAEGLRTAEPNGTTPAENTPQPTHRTEPNGTAPSPGRTGEKADTRTAEGQGESEARAGRAEGELRRILSQAQAMRMDLVAEFGLWAFVRIGVLSIAPEEAKTLAAQMTHERHTAGEAVASWILINAHMEENHLTETGRLEKALALHVVAEIRLADEDGRGLKLLADALRAYGQVVEQAGARWIGKATPEEPEPIGGGAAFADRALGEPRLGEKEADGGLEAAVGRIQESLRRRLETVEGKAA